MEQDLLALAKAHAKIEEDYDDDLVLLYIGVALELATKQTGFLFERKRVEEHLPLSRGKVKLSHTPVGPVSIFFNDLMHPVQATADDTNRVIVPLPNQQPSALSAIHPHSVSVKVEYESGSDSVSDIPPAIKLGILKYVAHAYDYRDQDNGSNTLVASGAAMTWGTYQSVAF